jgi:integrase
LANYCLRACPDYLEAAGHGQDLGGALFRPMKNNTDGTMEGAITADGTYRMVKHYAKSVGVDIEGFGAHSLRATAATNALDHEADIAKVQERLGHANIAASRSISSCFSLMTVAPPYRIIGPRCGAALPLRVGLQ